MKTKVKLLHNGFDYPFEFAEHGDIGYIDGYVKANDAQGYGKILACVIVPRVKRIEVVGLHQIEILEEGLCDDSTRND